MKNANKKNANLNDTREQSSIIIREENKVGKVMIILSAGDT